MPIIVICLLAWWRKELTYKVINMDIFVLEKMQLLQSIEYSN